MPRFRIVGRQEHEQQQPAPMGPGATTQATQTVRTASLFVVPVDASGATVQQYGMGGYLQLPVASLDDVAELATGTVVELVPVTL